MATRWKPDTCGCVFDVDDWDVPTGRTVFACPQHVGLTNDAHLALVLNGENRPKNYAMGAFQRAVPRFTDDMLAANVTWSLVPAPVGQARSVELHAPVLTGPERAAVVSALAALGGKAQLK